MSVSLVLAQSEGGGHYNAGLNFMKAGKYREAITAFSKVIEADADNADAYSERSGAWLSLQEYDKAIADASDGIKLKPYDYITFTNRGRSWLGKGEFDKALADFNEAIRLKGTDVPSFIANRGLAWQGKGEFDKALADFNQAIRLDRTNDHTYYLDRAGLFNSMGNFAKADDDFREAVRIAPTDVRALDELAWILATCPDAKVRNKDDAFKYASQCHQLSGGNSWQFLDTLAAAYAENGAFTQARETQLKVIELAPEARKAEYRTRLELYKLETPYRQERILAPPDRTPVSPPAP